MMLSLPRYQLPFLGLLPDAAARRANDLPHDKLRRLTMASTLSACGAGPAMGSERSYAHPNGVKQMRARGRSPTHTQHDDDGGQGDVSPTRDVT